MSAPAPPVGAVHDWPVATIWLARPARRNALSDELADVLGRILDHPTPVVGRVAGSCYGMGLAAACDISIVQTSAQLGFTEVRLGVAPAIISVICLPKLRRSDALGLFLAGERITAERAAEVGLVTCTVPDDQLDQAISTLITPVLGGGPEALAAAKRSRSRAMSEMSAALFASDEAAEGIAAQRERRPPAWTA